MIRMRLLVVAGAFALSAPFCLAQWTKTIDCPKGTIYTDFRKDAGRTEYCDLILPGGLHVKDGPSRFWFSSDFEGAVGSYSRGRERGRWKECDRFGHCENKEYPALYPEEANSPGIKDEIPITFVNGKYVVDFTSCRATRITYMVDDRLALELNIHIYGGGCFYAYFTEEQIERGMESRDLGHSCIVPFNVGKKAFDSLNLMEELPKQGLPQYCKHDVLVTGPIGSEVEPTNDVGSGEIFTATYDTGNNGVGIAQARLHFQKNAASRSDRCVVRYDPSSRGFYLLSDQPGKLLGPLHTGDGTSIWNNECLLSSCSQAELAGTTLTVHFAIRFNPLQFSGEHHMYLELVGTDKQVTPAGDSGHWTVPAEDSTAEAKPWPSDKSCPNMAPVAH